MEAILISGYSLLKSFCFRNKMDSGDLGGLESTLQNMQISSNSISDLKRMINDVGAIYEFTLDKLEDEEYEQTIKQTMDTITYSKLPSSFNVEADLHIRLNFLHCHPILSNNGLIYLKGFKDPGSECPFTSPEGYIRCDSVRNYINMKLEVVLASVPSSWSLQLIHGRHGYTQTIEVKFELVTVYINFIPVFEFQASEWPLAGPPVAAEVCSKFPWFAVPWQNAVNNDNHAFTAYAPFWVNEILKELPNSTKFSNLLMSWHAKCAKDLPNFSTYMLKSFMLRYVLNNGQRDVELDQFVNIMPHLLVQLNTGRLDSFLVEGENMLECMSVGEIQQCLATFKDFNTEL